MDCAWARTHERGHSMWSRTCVSDERGRQNDIRKSGAIHQPNTPSSRSTARCAGSPETKVKRPSGAYAKPGACSRGSTRAMCM